MHSLINFQINLGAKNGPVGWNVLITEFSTSVLLFLEFNFRCENFDTLYCEL